MKHVLIILFTTLATQSACASIDKNHAPLPELKTVGFVDLEKYSGLWHQIAFYPTRFQKNCTIDTTAQYSLRSDGKVNVVNECTKPNGKRVDISGTARIVDEKTQAKLKVKFFWFAPAGDYWVIDLGPNYEYAAVGTPDRKFFWILSRTPSLSKKIYDGIVARAELQGFERSKIQITSEVTE